MSKRQVKTLQTLISASRHGFVRQWRRFVSLGSAWIVAVGLLVLAPLFTPSAAMADDTGNWFLDDGSGHKLGAVLFERSDINAPSGLRLRLNAETAGLKLNHTRPMVMSDGAKQAWSLDNLSQELLSSAGGAIPVGSSQFDAGCLNPIPEDGMAMRITVPSSAGDLNFALAPGQVQTMHSLSSACAN